MPKLEDFTTKELEELERQYARNARNMLDKHQRWEAEQKLKLVLAEIQRRANPVKTLTRKFKKLLGN